MKTIYKLLIGAFLYSTISGSDINTNLRSQNLSEQNVTKGINLEQKIAISACTNVDKYLQNHGTLFATGLCGKYTVFISEYNPETKQALVKVSEDGKPFQQNYLSTKINLGRAIQYVNPQFTCECK